MDATATRNYLLNRILRKGSHVRKFKPSSGFLGFPQTRQPCGQRFMELLMVLQPPRGTLAVWKAGSLSDPNQDSFPFPEHSDSFTSQEDPLGFSCLHQGGQFYRTVGSWPPTAHLYLAGGFHRAATGEANPSLKSLISAGSQPWCREGSFLKPSTPPTPRDSDFFSLDSLFLKRLPKYI